MIQDSQGNFHVHGYIYQIGYPYWSYYGIPVPGEYWYTTTCCCDAFGLSYSCNAYYYYTTTYPYVITRSITTTPTCYGNEEGWRWYGWQYSPGPTDSRELRYFPFHIKIGYAGGVFTTPIWAKLFESDLIPADQRGWARAMTVDINNDVYVAYRRDDVWTNNIGLCIVQKLDANTGNRIWMQQLGDQTTRIEIVDMTMNDFDNQLLLAGDHVMWGGGRFTSITVMDPATGVVVDVWMYRTSSNNDFTTIFRKQYISGKQFFFLGVNARTDYIYWGKIHGGMFKINQTYGYESGFYLGTPDHNYLYGLDVDLYENYYLGWERQYPETNLTAWNYKVGWGAT